MWQNQIYLFSEIKNQSLSSYNTVFTSTAVQLLDKLPSISYHFLREEVGCKGEYWNKSS